MKQAQRLQQQMATVQASLAQKTIEAQAGGGAVKVVARCDQSIVSIKILPDAVNPQDVPFLEDLVVTAVNDALRQAKEVSEKEMGAVTNGLSMPGLF